jgi:hypothetical protein
MHSSIRELTILAALCAAPVMLHAQFNFAVDGRDVQFHSFVQQGFAYTNQNNFLTMNTSNGSFAMTDAGVNVSTSLTDKFRVGAQVYARNIGQLGDYHVQLDWAYGDYKFKDWFGIRAGEVKTALGLLNDVQDMEFLQTWAILPQSVYPLDLRSNTIAHTGVDIYGQIGLHKAGSLSYTAYYGARSNDKNSGTYFGAADTGDPIQSLKGRAGGGDLRWNTPLQGLMLGGSWTDQTENVGILVASYGNIPLNGTFQPQHLTSAYGDYVHGRWHFSGEYRKNREIFQSVIPAFQTTSSSNLSDQGFFLTAAFRVTKFLEVGTYSSRYYVDQPEDTNPAASHIFDQTVTARIDITKWWNVKVEEHFMNGYGDTYSSHGFYLRDNTDLQPKTNMLVVRMGYTL